MSAFDDVVRAIRSALVPPNQVVRDERYPASVTILKRELHELTITIKHGDHGATQTFQINVQEVKP